MWSQRRRTGLPCAFEYGGDPLAAPNTHRLEAVASLPAFELVQHRRHDACPGRAYRVAQGDPGAIDIKFVTVVPSPALLHREHLAGKGLVELHEVDVVPAQARAFEQACDRWHRANAHRARMAACSGPADEVRHGF